ncbi:MAG: hypothetical protein MUO85_06135, partial [candidate division Zixibacteria bacterium]|nr:hypothetical protein [candidate division Zixibacteria bacterium]
MRALLKGRVERWFIIVTAVGLVFLLEFSDSIARMKELTSKEAANYYRTAKTGVVCNVQQRVHRVNKVAFCVTNWGFFGSQTRDVPESKGGCFMPDPESEIDAESFEYPIGSSLEYLFQGALWIGGVVPGRGKREGKLDTLVSVGHDGWKNVSELFPDGPAPAGAIVERTTRLAVPNMQYADACVSSEAVSEQDIISAYDDLLISVTDCGSGGVDDFDNSTYPYQDRHTPIGVRVTQKSYAWSYSYAEDFFLMDFWIKNVNPHEDTIKDMWIGIYIDADVVHFSEAFAGSQDDICGYLDTVRDAVDPNKLDTIATAWIADNDGFPDGDGPGGHAGAFFYKSCTSVSGVRVVRRPPAPPGNENLPDSLKFNTFFNWWTSDQAGGNDDWGPRMQKNMDKWYKINPYGSGYNYPDALRGTPGGDISKYFVMSNREWDYDQIYAAVDSSGWTPPNRDEGAEGPSCENVANGFDTRYLFSFGPIDSLAPGDSVPVTIGYIAGANFHSDPYNFERNFDFNNPSVYYSKLNFSDFITNSQWAKDVYDNPGVDTDPNDGRFPQPIIDPKTLDTTGYTGDSVPDFKGPPPPPSPQLSFGVKQGQVTISWNGKKTELSKDSFTGKRDFEGYRLYMAEAKLGADYSLIHSADKVDFQLWKYNQLIANKKFEYRFPSVPAESLWHWFWSGVDSLAVFDSLQAHTDSVTAWTYTGDSITIKVGDKGDEKLTIKGGDKFFFRMQDWNRGFAGIAKYPLYRDSVNRGQVTDTLDKYWDYEYTVSGLLPSRQMAFAVTAFDYGNPPTGLEPLESGKSINETKIYPVSTPQEVKAQGKKVVVYPNPYRADGNYQELGFEDPDKSGWTEFDR